MDSMLDLGTLYYIMDEDRNLYKISFNDQLVVTCDVNEARKFTYEEATERIGNKHKFYKAVPVNEAKPRVEAAYDEVINEDSYKNIGKQTQNHKSQEGSDEESNTKEEFLVSELLGFEVIADLDKFINDYYNICNRMKDYYERLKKQYSLTDMELLDIMHLVELYDLSDDDYIECCEKLKRIRVERRVVKDEIFKCDTLRKALCNTKAIGDVKQVKEQFEQLKNRKYKPRVLSELFEGKHEFDRRYVINEDEVFELNKIKPAVDFNSKCNEVKYNMEYIWKETPFDNSENDWMAFARRQQEFYSNVEQYMINLNIDLDDIESKLEGLLIDMENEELEVGEEFIIAREVKRLRVERKNKLKELNQLQRITGNIDIRYMADESNQVVEDFDNKYGMKKECISDVVSEDALKTPTDSEAENGVLQACAV